MEKLFEGYGIEITQTEGKYFLRYDAGEIVCDFEEFEISQDDLEKAQNSEKDAYDVIIKYKNKQRFGN